MSKHRHERTSWFIGGSHGGVFWCYQCGAIREAEPYGGNSMCYKAGSKCQIPSGEGGENPEMKRSTK